MLIDITHILKDKNFQCSYKTKQISGRLKYNRIEGNGNPLQYSCLANPMDKGAWWAAVHGVTRSRTRLKDFTFTFHFHALEKAMATHSSVLAWRIPGTGEAWLAAVYGVTQSRTRLKGLSSSSSTMQCVRSWKYNGKRY